MACVASLVVTAPHVARVRASRRAPAPARPALARLNARPQRSTPRGVAAAAKLGKSEDDGPKITRDREPEEVRLQPPLPWAPRGPHRVVPPPAAAFRSRRAPRARTQYWKSEGEREGKSPLQDPVRAARSASRHADEADV